MARWMMYRKKEDFQAIAKELNISQVTARLVRNRNVIGVEETRKFLYGTMADLDDPADLPGLRDAAFVLKRKILDGEPIRVIGDYDVDGICSTYILWRLISFLGGKVSCAIPERIRDGYGINERLVNEAIRDGVDTIITCDNGIAAAEPLRLAKEAGLTVIVTDHHEIPYREEMLPEPPDDAGGTVGRDVLNVLDEMLPEPSDASGDRNPSEAEGNSAGGAAAAAGEYPSSPGHISGNPEGGAAAAAEACGNPDKDRRIRKQYIYPPADVIAEPWIPDEKTGEPIARFPSICGAVVVFKLAMLLLGRPDLTGPKSDREPGHVQLARELLGFAGIATVCDVMPLQDENRILVREGLKEASHTDNVGLRCLMSAAGLQEGNLTVYHAGFVIGPCLNASGRLDTAQRALALFQENNENRAMTMARDLKQLNDSRKSMTEEGLKRALQQVEEDAAKGRPLSSRRVLVVRVDDCHESLAGIIAGRLREQYHRPVIVLTRAAGSPDAADGGGAAVAADAAGTASGDESGTKRNGAGACRAKEADRVCGSSAADAAECAPDSSVLLKGSGRSIEAYDMFGEMNRCRELFVKFGGHKMAAGLTITAENAMELDRRLNESCTLTEEEMEDVLHIDMELPLSFVTREMVREFDLLEPCGNQNAQVLLAARDLMLRRTAVFGRNRNVNRIEAIDAAGRRYDCVLFAMQENVPEALQRGPVRANIVYEPQINEWKGRESVRFKIRDMKLT